MQCFRRGRLVLHHGDADVVRAGIAAIGLVAREVSSGHHAHASFGPQSFGYGLTAALLRNVQPKKESAVRALISLTVPDDLIGKIELGGVKRAILLHMGLITVSGNRHVLRRRRHLRCRHIAQFKI